MAEEEIDFNKLPIEERIQHKNWKGRVSGYEALVNVLNEAESDKASEFNKYASLLKKAPVDTNVTAQEKGLGAVLAFLNNANMSISAKIANDIITGCLTKAILQTRPKIKELNLEIILMYVELEKHQLVVDELISNFENKSPKIAVGCLFYTREALKQFGPKIIKVGPIIKLLPTLLEHKDKNVREETRQLTIEIYRWIKDAMKPQISNLKQVILCELEEEFKKVQDDKATATRFIKSEQVQNNEACANESEETGETENVQPNEIDPYEFIEAVEILSKIPNDFYEKVEAKKWQERKDVLESVINLLETIPKIAPGDFGELCKSLKKLIGKDANIVVVTTAAKCLAELAKKLRKDFAPYSHSCTLVVIEKFKEKKQNVLVALRDAVDACLISANFETILEEIINYLNNKNPQIRLEVSQMINRYISVSHLDFLSNKKNIKILSSALITTLNDMDGSVRDSSAECLGTLMKAVTEKVLSPFLNDVEPIKLAKIKENFEKATVKYNVPSSSSNATTNKQPEKKPEQKSKPVNAKNNTASRPKSTSTLIKKTATNAASKNSTESVARPATTIASKSKTTLNSKSRLAKPFPSSVSKTEEPSKALPLMSANGLKEQRLADEKQLKLLRWTFTAPREEFFTELKELMQLAGWNSSLISNCFHVDFKFHLKAIDSLNEFISIEENEESILQNSDLIFKWIVLRFFDTNPSVILKLFDLLIKIFDVMKNRKILLNDIEAQNFVPYLIIKAGDPKDILRQKVHEILNRIKDIFSPIRLYTFVANGLTSKNARQRTSCLDELSCFIKTYGTAVCQPSMNVAVKEISKQIGDKDSSVRNAALNCILEVYNFENEKVFKIIGNLNHKELEMLEKRIKRAPKSNNNFFLKPLEPTILIKEKAQVKIPVVSNTIVEETVEDDLDKQQPVISKTNGVVHKTLIKPRSNFKKLPQKISNEPISKPIPEPTEDQYSDRSKTPSPDLQHKNINLIRGSSVKSKPLKSTLKPIQLDFQDTDLEYNKIDNKESKYSTYKSSSIFKLNQASKIAIDDSIEEILSEPAINLPKRKSTFGLSPFNSNSRPDKNLNSVFTSLVSSEIETVIEALNQINEVLNNQKLANEYFANSVDKLVLHCSMQLRLITTKYSEANQDDVKVKDLFTNVILSLFLIFKNDFLAKKVTSEALIDLIPKAFDFLVYKRLFSKIDERVNRLIFVILLNSDLTEIFVTMIRLLHRFIEEDKDSDPSEYTNLTIKCFWKLTRLIDKEEHKINVGQILIEIKNFLDAFPSSYWKSYPSKNETAYRTIKTLIYILVKNKKQRIFLHMNKIPNKEKTALYKLLEKAIEQVKKEDTDSNEQNDLSIEELNFISEILNKLRDELKQDYFYDIIDFCNKNPTFNLKEFIYEFHTEFFANYVEKKLSEMKENNKSLFNTNNHQNGNQLNSKTIDTNKEFDNKSTNLNKQVFGYDRSNLNEKICPISLKKLPNNPEELNVENIKEWYSHNLKSIGVDSNTIKQNFENNSNFNDNLDETIKLSIQRTENVLAKSRKFLEQYKND